MRGIVFSSHINAYALHVGTHKLGIKLTTTDINPNFSIPYYKSKEPEDWLFFTEEDSLKRALKGIEKGKFFPSNFPLELLDNKWTFGEWLKKNNCLTPGLLQWSIFKREDINYPCVCKAKHSWNESVKLPRGWICRSEQELNICTENLIKKGFNLKHFFLQEWLGDSHCRLISVCGFHDSEDDSRNLTAVVERIASYSDGLSCSSALETIEDEWNLINKTASILDRLKFTGPFEMEFIINNSHIFVLELNPRFWMQHSIFLTKGNGVIKRYLKMDENLDREQKSINRIIWIDGLYLLRSISLLKLNFLWMVIRKYFERKKEILIFPSILNSFFIASKLTFKKIFFTLKKIF